MILTSAIHTVSLPLSHSRIHDALAHSNARNYSITANLAQRLLESLSLSHGYIIYTLSLSLSLSLCLTRVGMRERVYNDRLWFVVVKFNMSCIV